MLLRIKNPKKSRSLNPDFSISLRVFFVLTARRYSKSFLLQPADRKSPVKALEFEVGRTLHTWLTQVMESSESAANLLVPFLLSLGIPRSVIFDI